MECLSLNYIGEKNALQQWKDICTLMFGCIIMLQSWGEYEKIWCLKKGEDLSTEWLKGERMTVIVASNYIAYIKYPQ